MRILTIWAAVIAAAAALPGAASAQSLEEALAQSYAANPRLLGERAALRATDEGVSAALSAWRPTVSLSSNYGHRQQRLSGSFFSSDDFSGSTPGAVGLRLSQPLYQGGATTAQTHAAEERVVAGRARLVDVEQQVLSAAASAYVAVVRDQSVVELNQNNEQVLERQLQATRDRFHVGEVTRTDVSQAEARVADARASRIESEGTLESARAGYENLMGVLPGRLEFPAMDGFSVPATAAAALELSGARNPSILAAAASERAALHDVSAAGANLLPRVTLDAMAQRGWSPNSFTDESDTLEVTANVLIPLYQSGAEYARVRQLREIALQRRRELDTARRMVRESVAQSWEQLQTARARVDAFEASVEANGIALEGVQQEAAVGARTVLDVLDAEQELFEARVNLVRAEAAAADATFRLLSVVGGMTARALRLPVELYDPTDNYDAVRGKWLGFDAGRGAN